MRTSRIFILLLFIVLTSCTISEIEDFVVGDNFINDRTGIVMIDTLTLQTSILKFDSITSNSAGRLLLGSNYNTFSGYKKSDAYFEMIFDGSVSYTDFVVDSVCLVMNYDAYSAGDTMPTQTFTIYELSERMALDENDYLYTTSYFDHFTKPLGAIQLNPEPNSTKEINMRLSDQFGERLANLIREENDTLFSSDLFKDFFNGICIHSQENAKGAVFGIQVTASDETESTDSDSGTTNATTSSVPEIRLYYHLKVNPSDLSGLYYKFSFDSDGIYYNQVTANAAGTPMEGLSGESKERNSKLTNNQLFAQSGIQVFSKINLPHIDNLLWMGKNSAFIGATLRLFPVRGTYSSSASLPDSLYVFTVDKKNNITSQLTKPGTETNAFALLTIEKDVEETIYYEVDISSFIDAELKEELETVNSLLIGFGSAKAKTTAEHLILGASNSGKYTPEMNIYYYHN
ncbi:MAG: DUF4270 family protein [Prolixibacteraceae bacterium]|nr:DUF4270 family protein [Prolixibacteraceae bacterium]